MNDKASLLDQLRIDRDDSATTSRHGFSWAFGILACVALAGGGAWAYLERTAALPVTIAIAEEAEAIQQATRGSTLDASGYVVARRQATVSAKMTGKVVELLIEEGQEVEAGEVVARLDDSNERAAVMQAEAQLAQAQANLEQADVAFANAQPIYERNREQFERDVISAQALDIAQAEFDSARTSLTVAERAVAVAEANLEVARRRLDDTIVRAPFAGVVTVKAAQEGEMVSPVSAGGGFTRTGIGTIVDMDSLEIEVDVSENFINRVHPQQDVTVRLNAYPDWRIPARVIAIIPTADRAKATVRVRVGLLEQDARVLPQMGVRVAFLDEADDASAAPSSSPVVRVPPEAVEAVEADDETGIVYVVRDGRLERRAVRLGQATPAGQIVVSGLRPGAELAVGDFAELTDGLKVRVAEL